MLNSRLWTTCNEPWNWMVWSHWTKLYILWELTLPNKGKMISTICLLLQLLKRFVELHFVLFLCSRGGFNKAGGAGGGQGGNNNNNRTGPPRQGGQGNNQHNQQQQHNQYNRRNDNRSYNDYNERNRGAGAGPNRFNNGKSQHFLLIIHLEKGVDDPFSSVVGWLGVFGWPKITFSCVWTKLDSGNCL